MTTKVIFVDSRLPAQDKIEEAVDILRAGGIVSIPTETVFGLACNADNRTAVEKLYKVKNRPPDKSFVIQIACASKLIDYGVRITPEMEDIVERFWPGPLTIIAETKKGKMGFRVPDNSTALLIINKAEFSLAVTSANLSGEDSLLCADDVMSAFAGKVQAVIDDGTRASGLASTILDCTQSPFKILRKGSIARQLYPLCRGRGQAK
jgi:L-threonylcarbamoyladenylate synthase